ncbi:MAG: hypothetical protein V1867_03940 [Candidatus Falkowbacteria bacterium]
MKKNIIMAFLGIIFLLVLPTPFSALYAASHEMTANQVFKNLLERLLPVKKSFQVVYLEKTSALLDYDNTVNCELLEISDEAGSNKFTLRLYKSPIGWYLISLEKFSPGKMSVLLINGLMIDSSCKNLHAKTANLFEQYARHARETVDREKQKNLREADKAFR